LFQDSLVDYYLFTDDRNVVDGDAGPYRVRHIELWNNDKIKTSRRVKLSPHTHFPKYDYSVWVDGQVTILNDFIPLIRKMGSSECLFMAHRDRNTVEEEVEEIYRVKKKQTTAVEEQIRRYKEEGYDPTRFPLIESSIQIRKHAGGCCRMFFDTWRHEVEVGSNRDQVGFGYALWKTGLPFSLMPPKSSRETSFYFHIPPRHG